MKKCIMSLIVFFLMNGHQNFTMNQPVEPTFNGVTLIFLNNIDRKFFINTMLIPNELTNPTFGYEIPYIKWQVNNLTYCQISQLIKNIKSEDNIFAHTFFTTCRVILSP